MHAEMMSKLLQENKNKKRKSMSIVYGYVPKPKSNIDICTNLVGVPFLGWVMLDPL